MPKKWSKLEEEGKRKELVSLYVKDNKTIGETADILGLAESSVFERLIRLRIKPRRSKKLRYNNRNFKVVLPKEYSSELAEFIGILLGDGHLTPTQVTITLGKKDEYVGRVIRLVEKLFKVKPKCITSIRGDNVIYFGSTAAARWLISMGLVFNKVKAQVDIPSWCFSNKKIMRAVIRGLFDTDGSVYKLRFGTQISFCNRSRPLLKSVRLMLFKLGFRPSEISGYNVYLTRRSDLHRFMKEIGFGNKKHSKRFLVFTGGWVSS